MSRSRKKRAYQRSRRFDPTCRSHGGCPACWSNRMHAFWQRAGVKSRRRHLSHLRMVTES